MTESRSKVSILRITTALVVLCASFTLIIGAFLAGRAMGEYRGRTQIWSRDIRSAQWNSILARFAGLDSIEDFGVRNVVQGDAVPLYWPNGVSAEKSPCARVTPANFDGVAWEQFGDRRQAARCERIEQFVRAAHMSDMDLAGWLAGLDPAAAPGSSTYFGVYRAPLEEMGATLARAHGRILDGDLDGAESDVRAVVSAGLHFMRGSVDLDGIVMASMRVGFALDHLREIDERRGDQPGARRIVVAAGSLAAFRKEVFALGDATMKAAAMPEQLHHVTRMAEDPAMPLGLRLRAAVAVGYGGMFNPPELAFGPIAARRRALDALAADPVFAVAAARAREPYGFSVKKRYSIYTMLN